MNLHERLSTLSAETCSPETNVIPSWNLSVGSSSFRVAVIFTTPDGPPHSITTAISSELKKTHERIGQILAGNQNLA